ncbi:hypothetical protein [Zoogloea sp.]|uniref:hypothetical protein n=1 Tax=Zoogloea sp. TaxID=49181 RepID=UPI0025ED595E|nr:hypothetical protein [Zoogloea sp.]
MKVALLQTNIEQGLKWRPEMLQRWLDVNLTMLRANPADVVVLPETTLPCWWSTCRRATWTSCTHCRGQWRVILGTFTR